MTLERNYRRLPPQHMSWEVDGSGIYLVHRGKRHRVRSGAILANGTRDAVIVETNGEIGLASIHQPFEGRVLHRPTHDLVVFMFEERLPPPYSMSVLILEIDEELEPLIREMCRRWPMLRREEYDAHLGGQYWRPI